MYTLIAECSNFILEHSIHIVDSNNNIVAVMHMPVAELANFVAHDSRISAVKLTGIAEYCYAIKEEIENQLALEYANNQRQVEIEVI